MRYAIYEGYMPKLEKKINRIKNKCEKFGCDFRFEVVGEEYRDVPNQFNEMVVARFVIVEAEGTAVVNNWEFVASVEHTKKGNIYSKALTDIEIPKRYRTMEPVCEHCNTNRMRKYLFIIRNTETGEFKQVGRSCLMDYTCGMSADYAAYMASLREVFEAAVEYIPGGGYSETYVKTEEILPYAAEVVRHFGYVRSDPYVYSTRERTENYFCVATGRTGYMTDARVREIKDEMKEVGFDPENKESVKLAKDALKWIKKQEAKNDYMHNLKVVAENEYTHFGRLGLLVSLLPVFNKDLERQAELRRREEQAKRERKSDWVGEVGKRVEIDVESVNCVTSWSSCYDGYNTTTTFLMKIIDVCGNVFIWKTQKNIEDASKLIGTVKEHSEFNGVKQTVLTRCRIA